MSHHWRRRPAAGDAGTKLLRRARAIQAGPQDRITAELSDLQKSLAETEIPLSDRHALRQVIGELQQAAKKQSKQHAAESAGVVREARQQLLDAAEKQGGHAMIVGEVPEAPVEQVREAVDWLRTQAGSAAILLGMRSSEGKPMLLAAMTDDLVARGLHAGELIKAVAEHIGGRGGGKPNLAQAGGKNSDGVPEALKAGAAWLRERVR